MSNTKPDLDDKKILILEYKSNLHVSWDNLENDGYEIDYAFSIKNTTKKILTKKYSLLIINFSLLMKEDVNFDLFLKNNDIPTIFLIDNDDDKKLIETFNKSEFFDFLKKPIDFLFLQFKIETLLRLFKKEQELICKNKKIESLNKIINGFTAQVNQEVEQKNSCFILQNAILNAIPANICLIDNMGIILTVNENWCEFGKNFRNKNPNFAIGLNYFNICKKAFKKGILYAKLIRNGINSVLDKEKPFFNMEYNLFEDMWFKILVTPLIYEKDKIGAILTHVDISTQKKLELDLKKSEEYFRALMSNSPNAILEVNRNLEITYINKSRKEIKIEDILGKKVFQFVEPEFHKIMEDTINNVFETHKKNRYEAKLISENEKEFYLSTVVGPVIIDGKVNSVILLNEDITTKKKMELELRKSEEHFRSLTLNTPNSLVEVNRDLEIIYINKIRTGLKIENVLGKKVFLFFPIEFHQTIKNTINKVFETHEKGSCEAKLISQNNEELWFSAVAGPLIINGKVNSVILSIEDITNQKKLELDLRKSEEYFRSLTFNAPNVIIEVDRNLEVTYINKYENNFKIDDILGKKFFTFVPSEFQEMVKNKIEGVFKTGIKDVYDTQFIYQNGIKKWFTTNVGAVKINGEINSVILLADDITERKEMEEKLKSNTNFLLEAQKLAKVGILELNLELEIIHFSEQIFEIFNIEKKENIFLTDLLEKVHIDDIDDLKKFINHIDLNEDIFEFRLIFDNSIIKYISATTQIKIDKYIILTLQDITQQKKHEITLEHIYKGVSNETGIDYLKKLTNFICEEFEVNYSYVARFYPEKNMINLLAFGGKEDLSRIFLNFDLLGTPCEIVLNTKESFYSNSLQEDFSKNDFIKIKNLQGYIGIPVFNNSNIIGLIVIMDDKKLYDINYKIKLLNIFSFRVASEIDRMISEEEIIKSKTKLEKTFIELTETQKQLIHQERLKALGEMASGIVHDFNNALTPILGYSELLLENKDISPNKMTKYLQAIRKATLNSASVVRGLREFYRKNSSNEFYENILINDIVKEIVELTKHKWKNQAQSNNCYIKIDINLEKTQFIFGNLSEIKEILTNLIFNAVDSITKKGTITISTRDEDDKVILEVSDTGNGMTEEVKSRIFEPFFTTKGNEGTGLGLSMIYGIVQRHKGKINIDSIVDKGTCFSIYFPAAIKNNLINKKQIQKKLERSLHILIVEDELDIQEIVSNYLLLENHTFEIANNGLEGLEKFQKGYFDLIITDYAMPEMNGRQMGDSIKLLAPDKPIILLTGFGDIIVSTNDKIDSIDYVICKPISIADLETAINYLF